MLPASQVSIAATSAQAEGELKVQSSKLKDQTLDIGLWTLDFQLSRMPFNRSMWADSSVGRATGF
jgi:hypothetical protein